MSEAVYRYRLARRRPNFETGPLLVWIMLNPSTADDEHEDQTTRRVSHFTEEAGGYAGWQIVNLFAARATQPTDLRQVADPVGPDNRETVRRALRNAAGQPGGRAVAAWGTIPRWLQMIRLPVEAWAEDFGVTLLCLGRNNDGSPRHPSRLPNAARLETYRLALPGGGIRPSRVEDTRPL